MKTNVAKGIKVDFEEHFILLWASTFWEVMKDLLRQYFHTLREAAEREAEVGKVEVEAAEILFSCQSFSTVEQRRVLFVKREEKEAEKRTDFFDLCFGLTVLIAQLRNAARHLKQRWRSNPYTILVFRGGGILEVVAAMAAAAVQRAGGAGWFYRARKPGAAQAGFDA